MSKFIDIRKIMRTKDRNGQDPAMIIVDTQRNVGKTVSTNKMVLENFIADNTKQFMLLYRYQTELAEIAEKFYTDIHRLGFFEGDLKTQSCSYNAYHKILYKEQDWKDYKICGYAVSINNAEKVKKQSAEFSSVSVIIYDEFQSETGKYCPQEIRKFCSIVSSVSRGSGKAFRNVPVIMLSNSCDKYNPYYLKLNLPDNIFTDNTKIYRGDGFVIHFFHSEEIAKEVKENNKIVALLDSDYLSYSTGDKSYLANKSNLVGKVNLKDFKYIYTLKANGEFFGVYGNKNKIFISSNYDKTSKCYATTKNDIDINITMLNEVSKLYLKNMWRNSQLILENEKGNTLLNTL